MKINSKTHVIGVTAAVAVIAFISGILLIMGSIAGELRQAIGTTGLINQYDRSFNSFVNEELSYEEMLKGYNATELGLTENSKPEIVQNFKNQRQVVEDIGSIISDNTALKRKTEELISNSIKQSDTYITGVVSKMIASTSEDLSLIEKQVILGASSNTNFNYQLQIKLNALKADQKSQADFMALIDKMINNAKTDTETLKDTTFAELPKAALLNNEQIKETVNRYIENQNKLSALQTQVISENTVLIKETNQLMATAMDRAVLRIIVLLVVMGILTIVGFASLTFFSRHAILKPLNRLSKQALNIANMNLDFEIEESVINKNDEIGALAASFHKMQQNLLEIVQEIKASSNEIALNAECVSNFNQDLAQGVEEQASALEQISATVAHTSQKIMQSTENVESALKDAGRVTTDAEKGQAEMVEMLLAIKEISESSTKISKVIKIIDDIAFQTNILALNAAVEAARAGQHGKGFAVVAEEVRNLAARSANAAKETTDMIESVLSKIDGGELIAKQTSGALEQMAEGIHRISDSIAQIATASQDESVAIQQINLAIAQVAEVVQGNTAISEEVSAISQEMYSQSEVLKEQTARFRFTDHANGPVMTRKKVAHEKAGKGATGRRISAAVGAEEDQYIALDDKEFDRY